jgi:hypothetical protein
MGTKTQQNEKWGNCRLARTTMKMLDKRGEYRDSYNSIIVKLLQKVEDKE